jgi:hypothetical protein
MADFAELKDLYVHLESCAGDYKYPHQIANLFQKLRDLKHEVGLVDEAKQAQREIDCFSFGLENGELKSHFTVTDDKGRPFEYPDVSRLSDDELDHIEMRLSETSNPILQARYAHILWGSKRKHDKYAKIAVDSYLELIKIYEEKDKKETGEHYGLDVLKSIENAYALAFPVNYKTDYVKAEMGRLVREFNFYSSSAFVLRANIIRLMLRGKNRFSNDDYDGFVPVCLRMADDFFKAGNFHNAIRMFERCENVENRLGTQTHDWNRRIAECYEGLVDQRGEKDLASVSFCQHALEYYQKIKDVAKVKELELRYDKIRGQQHYEEFSTTIDIKDHVKNCRKLAEKLCQKGPEEIISVLISDKSLLPRYKDMENGAEEAAKVAVVSSIFPVVVSDDQGHTSEHFTTEDEKKHFQILQQFSWHLKIDRLILIHEIMLTGVKTGKLNIHSVMEFFEKNSWYGKDISKRVPQGRIVTYNWLNLIAPAVNEYFSQVQAHLSYPEYRPNFVLSIDSLTLKIEGLVRDICIFSGVTTFFRQKDKPGRNVIREKDINYLLREEPIKRLFDEDDLLFFKYVLVEKAGMNLRHRIAHCLAGFSEYDLAQMHLLLLVLFRLGKYDFVKPGQPVEEKVEQEEQPESTPQNKL